MVSILCISALCAIAASSLLAEARPTVWPLELQADGGRSSTSRQPPQQPRQPQQYQQAKQPFDWKKYIRRWAGKGNVPKIPLKNSHWENENEHGNRVLWQPEHAARNKRRAERRAEREQLRAKERVELNRKRQDEHEIEHPKDNPMIILSRSSVHDFLSGFSIHKSSEVAFLATSLVLAAAGLAVGTSRYSSRNSPADLHFKPLLG
eukprot:TRINITY_DN5342_c1_g1_i1.p1 TRINITY_DN5342_c1_g1~~TRINITY_DN5342_c1_g1_i1.p1  ORF type:complete len:232 (-),score=44.87 TRINITY_DN5342_c1_g1_i1:165-782(-)